MNLLASYSVEEIISRNEPTHTSVIYIILRVLMVLLFLFIIAMIIFVVKKVRESNEFDIYVQSLVDSGEYKVFLDGKILDKPEGIDVRHFKKQVNEMKKIIRLTTDHTTNVYVDNHHY